MREPMAPNPIRPIRVCCSGILASPVCLVPAQSRAGPHSQRSRKFDENFDEESSPLTAEGQPRSQVVTCNAHNVSFVLVPSDETTSACPASSSQTDMNPWTETPC